MGGGGGDGNLLHLFSFLLFKKEKRGLIGIGLFVAEFELSCDLLVGERTFVPMLPSVVEVSKKVIWYLMFKKRLIYSMWLGHKSRVSPAPPGPKGATHEVDCHFRNMT